MSEGKSFNYQEINDYVEQRVSEIGYSHLEVAGHNLYKVVQHGLIDVKLKPSRPGVKKEWGKSPWQFQLIRRLKGLKNSPPPLSRAPEARVLISDPGPRLEQIGDKFVSKLFHRMITEELDNDVVYAVDSKGDFPYPLQRIDKRMAAFELRTLRSSEMSYYREILLFRSTWDGLGLTQEEQQCIDYWLMVHFAEYCMYGQMLDEVKPSKCMLVCHYHNEGLIQACRERGIETIDCQHGLISAEDLYYCYPAYVSEFKSKALFSDKIFVYGEYWKHRLLNQGNEFAEQSIVVKGDYFYYPEADVSASEFKDLKSQYESVVLITTQTWMVKAYCDYVDDLLKMDGSDKRCFLVKIHPRNDVREYEQILYYENVIVTKADLNLCFEVSDIHISIYSTTLFDALKFPGLINYTLFHPSAVQYAEEMARDGIAAPLGMSEVPWEKEYSGSDVDPEKFYAVYQPVGKKAV